MDIDLSFLGDTYVMYPAWYYSKPYSVVRLDGTYTIEQLEMLVAVMKCEAQKHSEDVTQ